MKDVWTKIKEFFKKYWGYIVTFFGLLISFLCGRHFRDQCLGLDESIELRDQNGERVTRATDRIEDSQSRIKQCQSGITNSEDRVEELIRDTVSAREIIDKYKVGKSETSEKK